MAVPFRPLVATRPTVLPETGNAFGQFTQGLFNGFGTGQARHQEDEVRDLMAEAASVFGSSLGNLMDDPSRAGPDREWTADELNLLQRMMRHPETRDWAREIMAAGPGPGPGPADSAAMS